MKEKDYSDTGQRSESDVLFEEIFQLAVKGDRKTKNAAAPEIRNIPRNREGAKEVSAPNRKPVEAPALKRRAATPTGKRTGERKTPLQKPRSKRVSKLLIVSPAQFGFDDLLP
jgi:hypothetical protein